MMSEPIQGNDGTTYETALHVAHRQYPYEKWTKEDEDWLRQVEDGWVYARYGRPLGVSPVPAEFRRLMNHTTEKGRGRLPRVYDIVTLTVAGTLTNSTYFDVTSARHVRPRS